MRLDPKLIAKGWMDHYFGELDELEQEFAGWAEDAVWAAVRNDADYALEIIDELHALVETNAEVQVFAAGPLEDLIYWQDLVVIEEIEKRAQEDPRFAHALGGVWKSQMRDEVWERVKKCRDTSLWADAME